MANATLANKEDKLITLLLMLMTTSLCPYLFKICCVKYPCQVVKIIHRIFEILQKYNTRGIRNAVEGPML